jgi:transposase-like protein
MYEIAFGMGFMMSYEGIEEVYHKKGVILDSRPVHSAIAHNDAIIDAQRKNRKCPFMPW